jgi:hypothetical protein
MPGGRQHMSVDSDDQKALQDLDLRLRTVLPETYQQSYETLQPTPMRSAGLKFADDGKVAWDEIWGNFCDLAMAGGPPHKGKLLEPGTAAAVAADPVAYQGVVDEICRGISMVTDLPADPSPHTGWVRVHCYTGSMAGWLLRAITMENVAARVERLALDLPAAPAFRLEKEIKNVITVIAKTCHYWMGHMKRAQRDAIAAQFARVSIEAPLVEPFFSPDNLRRSSEAPLFGAMAGRIDRETGLRLSAHTYAGWLGVECPTVAAAVWMMRALVVDNVLARREGIVLFVPVNPGTDPDGQRVCRSLARVHHLAKVRGVLG